MIGGISWAQSARRGFQPRYSDYELVQFTNSFFRREPQVLEGERQVYSEFNRARCCRTRRRIEEVIVSFLAHADSIALDCRLERKRPRLQCCSGLERNRLGCDEREARKSPTSLTRRLQAGRLRSSPYAPVQRRSG